MERAATEDEKAMYETMLKISKRVEIMYEALQKETEEKERLQLRRGPGRTEAQQPMSSNKYC